MDDSFERERQELVAIVGELYARNKCSEERMNELLDLITDASTESRLREIASQLPPLPEGSFLAFNSSIAPRPPQTVSAQAGAVKKTGTWLESKQIQVSGSASTFKFDLTSYGSERGISLEFLLEVNMSTVVLILPESFRAVDAIAENSMSTVRIKVKKNDERPRYNTVTLRGVIRMSTVKVKYR
jgi:hypothetical protein